MGTAIGRLALDVMQAAGGRPPLVERTERFTRRIALAVLVAAAGANLARLAHEYRRTERRVRALENIVLPEIHGDIEFMEEHLELVEQEEVIRVRMLRTGQV